MEKMDQAYCKVCHTNLRPHLGDLKKHVIRNSHQGNMAKLNQTNKQHVLNAFVVKITDEETQKDLKLAYYICMHTAIRNIDHLTELLRGMSVDFENIKHHRTKCSSIIKNVISPAWLEELIGDIQGVPFSLIIDESTDISVTKYMCVCVKYYSRLKHQVMTHFLGLIELEYSTAECLSEKLKLFLCELNLDKQYLIGLGTDGASALCGKHNSVFKLFKDEVPNLQLVRCICHSLNNAASKSAEELPASVEFLCREIYSWFQNSSVRQIEYRKVFDMLNKNKIFHNFVQVSTTRWLSRYNSVNIILEHWDDLKVHFKFVVNKEKCYTARL